MSTTLSAATRSTGLRAASALGLLVMVAALSSCADTGRTLEDQQQEPTTRSSWTLTSRGRTKRGTATRGSASRPAPGTDSARTTVARTTAGRGRVTGTRPTRTRTSGTRPTRTRTSTTRTRPTRTSRTRTRTEPLGQPRRYITWVSRSAWVNPSAVDPDRRRVVGLDVEQDLVEALERRCSRPASGEELAQAVALRGRVDPDDVDLAEAAECCLVQWKPSSRSSSRRDEQPGRVEPRLGHPLRQVGGVHRALLGVVGEGQRVDPDQLLGVGVAVAASTTPSGTTNSGSGSVSDRRITHSSRTRSNPCRAASARGRVVAVRPGLEDLRGPGRRAPSRAATSRARGRGVRVHDQAQGPVGDRREPDSSVHVWTRADRGGAGRPGRLVERRRPVGLLRGGGEQGDPVQGHGRHSRPGRWPPLRRTTCHAFLALPTESYPWEVTISLVNQ